MSGFFDGFTLTTIDTPHGAMRLRHLLTHSLARQREYNPRASVYRSTLVYFGGRAQDGSVQEGPGLAATLDLGEACFGFRECSFLAGQP